MNARVTSSLLPTLGLALLLMAVTGLVVWLFAQGGQRQLGPVDDQAAIDSGGVAIMGHATTYYGSLEEWAANFDGAAIVRIASVGPPQWNTPDGKRPSEAQLTARLAPESVADYFIGRRVEVAVVEVLTGNWSGPTGTYWLPGGTLGADVTAIEAGLASQAAQAGAWALAFTFDQPRPFGTGVATSIGDLMPINRDRLQTPDQQEQLTVSQLSERLRSPGP